MPNWNPEVLGPEQSSDSSVQDPSKNGDCVGLVWPPYGDSMPAPEAHVPFDNYYQTTCLVQSYSFTQN